jgi:peptidylprolyl isomerase
MRRPLLLVLLCMTLSSAASCSSVTDVDDRWSNPELIEYAESLHVDLSKMSRTASGLYWQDVQPGTADSAVTGDLVRVDYTGWLPDGTEFDSTEDAGPITFYVGRGQVLKGFDEGVIGMRIGGVRLLVIPPALAFGSFGNPMGGIPAAATVVMEVERLTTPAQ